MATLSDTTFDSTLGETTFFYYGDFDRELSDIYSEGSGPLNNRVSLSGTGIFSSRSTFFPGDAHDGSVYRGVPTRRSYQIEHLTSALPTSVTGLPILSAVGAVFGDITTGNTVNFCNWHGIHSQHGHFPLPTNMSAWAASNIFPAPDSMVIEDRYFSDAVFMATPETYYRARRSELRFLTRTAPTRTDVAQVVSCCNDGDGLQTAPGSGTSSRRLANIGRIFNIIESDGTKRKVNLVIANETYWAYYDRENAQMYAAYWNVPVSNIVYGNIENIGFNTIYGLPSSITVENPTGSSEDQFTLSIDLTGANGAAIRSISLGTTTIAAGSSTSISIPASADLSGTLFATFARGESFASGTARLKVPCQPLPYAIASHPVEYGAEWTPGWVVKL